ncbi:MAG: DUF423 domain-containing protein [Actinobacteria bacterium]|nr:DUF423 domain-containing protein [Actinomycetota bacterium]
MTRWLLVIAGAYGFCGVGLGAFGAHALRAKLPEDRMANLELAVRYLFFHVPALVTVAWLTTACRRDVFEMIAGWSFALGILLFSGSLVALALTGKRRWGAVTPFGGALLLVGWATLVLTASFLWSPPPGGFFFAC